MGHRTKLSLTLLLSLTFFATQSLAQSRPQSRTPNDSQQESDARQRRPQTRTPSTGQPRTNQPRRTPSTRTPAPRSQTNTSGQPPQRQANRNVRSNSQPRVITNSQQTRPGRRAMVSKTPPGFPLSPQDQRRVDQILRVWEVRTAKIKTHQCKFVRRNFDFVFGDRETPKTVDVGTIRYREPDKGLMRVDKVYDVTAQKKLEQKKVKFGEYWVCDGESIFQFDSRTKVLTETVLPPDLRGRSIGEGPLPFMFGAKSETMKSRYWIREIEPPDENKSGEYYLEAIPKRQQDAANVEKLLIILAVQNDYLFPKAMLVFNRQGKVVYEFKDHRPNDTRHRVQGFLNSFVKPKTPRGWKKITEDWDGNNLEQN